MLFRSALRDGAETPLVVRARQADVHLTRLAAACFVHWSGSSACLSCLFEAEVRLGRRFIRGGRLRTLDTSVIRPGEPSAAPNVSAAASRIPEARRAAIAARGYNSHAFLSVPVLCLPAGGWAETAARPREVLLPSTTLGAPPSDTAYPALVSQRARPVTGISRIELAQAPS